MKKITKLILLLCFSLMAVNVQAKLFSEDFETSVDAFSKDDGNTTNRTVATDLFHDGEKLVHNPYTENNNNIVYRNDVFNLTVTSNSQFYFFADDYESVTTGGDGSVNSGSESFIAAIDNDDCANAATAVVNNDHLCEQTTFGTLAGASASSVPVSCGTPVTQDAWFEFTATSDKQMVALLNGAGTDASNLHQAIYQGSDCDNLTEIFCSEEFSYSDNSSNIVASDLTIGETYYVRVFDSSLNDKEFTICITTPELQENTSCEDVAPFCAPTDDSGNPEPLIFPSGYFYQEMSYAEDGPDYGCLGSKPNPAWFYMRVQESGDLAFEIVQNTAFDGNGNTVGRGLDVDFIVYGPFDQVDDNCGYLSSSAIVDCSYSAAAIEAMNIPNAEANQIYMVLITNFTQPPGYISLVQTNFGESNSGSTDCSILDTTIYACEGDDVTFTSQEPDAISYVWYEYDEDTDAYEVLDIPEDQDYLTVSEEGSYKLVSYDETGTPSEEVFNLKYSPNPELDVDQDGEVDDLSTPLIYSICNADSVDLDATPMNSGDFASFTYEWVDEDGNEVATTPTYSTSTTGEFTVTVSGEIMDEDGNAVGSFCPVSETVIVESANFSVDLDGDQVFCDVADYTITADVIGADPADASFSWENANGEEISTDQSVTVDASGDYSVTVEVNGCPVTETVQVILEESPAIDLGEDQETCDLDSAVLDATPSNMDAADVTYSWSYEGDEIPETGATVDATDHGYGSYTVTAYGDSLDCDSSATVTISERDDIDVNLTVDDSDGLFCIGETAILTAEPVNASASELTFTWYEDGSEISGEDGESLTVEITEGFSTATYAVEITLGGCFANAEQELGTYEGGCDIPKGISPDVSVGINDCLDLAFLDRTGVRSLKLYNRYGRLVFEESNYVDSWCGQDKDGDKLKTGTYYYVLELKGNDPVFGNSKKGWIYVNREAN